MISTNRTAVTPGTSGQIWGDDGCIPSFRFPFLFPRYPYPRGPLY